MEEHKVYLDNSTLQQIFEEADLEFKYVGERPFYKGDEHRRKNNGNACGVKLCSVVSKAKSS